MVYVLKMAEILNLLVLVEIFNLVEMLYFMQVVPIQRFEEVVVEHGVSILQGIMGQTSHSDFPAANSGLSSVGEVRLIPDLSTKVTLPW